MYCRYDLKSVTTTLGLLFSWPQYAALHSRYHFGEPSLIPKLRTPALCISLGRDISRTSRRRYPIRTEVAPTTRAETTGRKVAYHSMP